MVVSVCFPTSREEFLLPHILTNVCCFCFVAAFYQPGVRQNLRAALTCVSLTASSVACSIRYFINPLYFSLEDYLLNSLVSLLIGGFDFWSLIFIVLYVCLLLASHWWIVDKDFFFFCHSNSCIFALLMHLCCPETV